jgi:hypothetical protein
MTGLILGFFGMVCGIALFLNGFAGSTNWMHIILNRKGTVTDAVPGAVLFAVGFVGCPCYSV